MQFALAGNHPDGKAAITAFLATGRHRLLAYHGAAEDADALRRLDAGVQILADFEELLAIPQVDAVIVASPIEERPAHLRRALQSERHVLCVHPADTSADFAYEAAMIRGDTGCVLLPLLPACLHPAFVRLGSWSGAEGGPPGKISLLEMEWRGRDSIPLAPARKGPRALLPGWEMVRALLGEITEVAGFSPAEEIAASEPLMVSGRALGDIPFRLLYYPQEQGAQIEITLRGNQGSARLGFAEGWPGPVTLSWMENGAARQESWPASIVWEGLVAQFESMVSAPAVTVAPGAGGQEEAGRSRLSWLVETRCLELNDAVRRSVHRRSVSVLEYPEATEVVGFKGTMTLVGCATLLGVLVLFVASNWLPWLGWIILPILVGFLLLQSFSWLASKPASRRRS